MARLCHPNLIPALTQNCRFTVDFRGSRSQLQYTAAALRCAATLRACVMRWTARHGAARRPLHTARVVAITRAPALFSRWLNVALSCRKLRRPQMDWSSFELFLADKRITVTARLKGFEWDWRFLSRRMLEHLPSFKEKSKRPFKSTTYLNV